jgi:Flp pilus assembly protein TadG
VGYHTDSAPPFELQKSKTMKRERGVGLLEFALVLPVFLLLQ